MRSIHVVRSLMVIAALFAFTAFAAISACAVEIAAPTEGRLVRDQVKIVVPRSSLSPEVLRNGFIIINVDGRFIAAVDAAAVESTDSKTPASPNIVYVWDSKAPINDPVLPEDQRRYRDGRHEIVVEAHAMGRSSKDMLVDSASVVVNLQNQVQRPDPAPPLTLRYRYSIGQQSKYTVSVTGEIMDSTGYSLTGGQYPIIGEFDMLQAVEDVEGDGSALMRYKVERDSAFTSVFGQTSLLSLTTRFPSVYKIVDNSGKIIDENVLSGKTKAQIADCLVRLPRGSVQIGETWPTEYRIKLEGLSDYTTFIGMSSLDGLEWEGGFECAKITTKMSGSPMFYFLPIPSGKVNAVNTAYFAYKIGKLIKDVTVVEFGTTLDNATLTSLQQQVPGAGMTSGMPSVGAGLPSGSGISQPTAGTGGLGRATSLPRTGGPMSSYYGSTSPSGSSMPGTSSYSTGGMGMANTAVKIRLVITKELRR